jgi:hypothetical protein
VGVFTNRPLLWGIVFELALAALLIYAPPFHALLATAALSPAELLFALPFPSIVRGADELRRYLVRRHSGSAARRSRSPSKSSAQVTTPGASGPAPSAKAAKRTTSRPVNSEKIAPALARPETYPHRPERAGVRKTHISWVFLADEYAYKLKKPLVLPFLAYGTPKRRRITCQEEVPLNRRLAPDV